MKKILYKPDIQANFWNGDPDIDAVCRMLIKPECRFKKNIFPFFSQKKFHLLILKTQLFQESYKRLFSISSCWKNG